MSYIKIVKDMELDVIRGDIFNYIAKLFGYNCGGSEG